MTIGLKKPLHPVPEKEKFDTGLRYTDILFGFVIRELFLRLQNWEHLDWAVHWHLIVGATLVLGSWIGFRRSLYRSGYQLKFFNLPLARFLVDQLMLILYFRIAVLTPAPGTLAPGATTIPNSGLEMASYLARETNRFVFYVFVLYVVWDLLGIWMAKAKIRGNGNPEPRYPEQSIHWVGIWITVISMLFSLLLWRFADCFNPFQMFVATTVLLLVYRWFKEMRTSCQLLRPV